MKIIEMDDKIRLRIQLQQDIRTVIRIRPSLNSNLPCQYYRIVSPFPKSVSSGNMCELSDE